MHQVLADRNCGMNTQAAELLARLSGTVIEVAPGFMLMTYPYSNCREMGFVISVCPLGAGAKKNFAFYEHRNSDNLCCIRWEGDLPISGGVTCDDIPTEAFPDKWSMTESWGCGEYWKAQEWLEAEIKEIFKKKEESNVS
jgi:hypothetical protein